MKNVMSAEKTRQNSTKNKQKVLTNRNHLVDLLSYRLSKKHFDEHQIFFTSFFSEGFLKELDALKEMEHLHIMKMELIKCLPC